MTIAELKKSFPLPEKILAEYSVEFSLNVPGSDEWESARRRYDAEVRQYWKDSGPNGGTMRVVAFNPPAAHAITFKQEAAWMLPRFSENDKEFYSFFFEGVIDRRLGKFSVNMYPVKIGTIRVNSVDMAIYRPHVEASVVRAEFIGLQSVITQYENGLGIDYDIARLKGALAYVNALAKFKNELQVTKDLAIQKANSEINKFANDLGDRLRRDANDLSQKKLALMVAIDNEKKSAVRDMQNLLLNAQSLAVK